MKPNTPRTTLTILSFVLLLASWHQPCTPTLRLVAHSVP